MEKSCLRVVFSVGRLFLPVLFFSALFCSPASAVEVTDAGINQMITVQTPASPLEQQASPKKLWDRYGKAYKPNFFVKVHRFAVTKGQKYTLYGYFPPDGQYRNLYVTGENPLTDYTYSVDSKGDMTGFVFWAQQPGKYQCPAVTRRVNLEISPRSEHNYLYAVAVTQKPGLAFSMALKTPGDPESDVASNTQDPSCPLRKGNTWGQTWTRPLILLLDPTEKEKTAAKPVTPQVTNPLEITDIALNQAVTIQTPAVPLDQSSSPKKLWDRYGKGYAPNFYVRIYRFTVNPGEKYTLYGMFPPDEVYRNFYVSGENPLSDHVYSWGDIRNVTTGFVFWSQQPGKWQCPAVTRRVTLTISPQSEHRHLHIIAVTKKPNLSFNVMLKSPADPDSEVEKSTQDPNCSPKKGSTWGQVWGTPFLLRYDPTEKAKSTGAATPQPADQPTQPQSQPAQPPPPPPYTPSVQSGAPGRGIRIEAENESIAHIVNPQASMKAISYRGYSGSGYWYLSAGGEWVLYPVQVQQGGTYYLWVKDLNDLKHPASSRSVDISIDCEKIASIPANGSPGPDHWGWHLAGTVQLSPGTHVLMVKKQATTPAAALLDAFYLSPDPSDRPQQ
jgi:hypothetical protein